jgi:hypothetical protein
MPASPTIDSPGPKPDSNPSMRVAWLVPAAQSITLETSSADAQQRQQLQQLRNTAIKNTSDVSALFPIG